MSNSTLDAITGLMVPLRGRVVIVCCCFCFCVDFVGNMVVVDEDDDTVDVDIDIDILINVEVVGVIDDDIATVDCDERVVNKDVDVDINASTKNPVDTLLPRWIVTFATPNNDGDNDDDKL